MPVDYNQPEFNLVKEGESVALISRRERRVVFYPNILISADFNKTVSAVKVLITTFGGIHHCCCRLIISHLIQEC